MCVVGEIESFGRGVHTPSRLIRRAFSGYFVEWSGHVHMLQHFR